MSNERALPISVQAARALASAGKGLVLVLFREQQVVGVLHVDVDPTSAAGTAAVATRADQAVLILVGSLKSAGHLMLEADETRKVLAANGVTVSGVVHVTALDGGQRWTDLSLTSPCDGIIGRLVGRRR